jgi:hypothetical protein
VLLQREGAQSMTSPAKPHPPWATSRCPASCVVRELDKLASARGLPEMIVTDSCAGVPLEGVSAGRETALKPPGKSVDNAYVAGFDGKFRDRCLSAN